MIPFDSPEGRRLRGLKPSRAALLALWFSALEAGDESWSAWARQECEGLPQDTETTALRFLQAVSDGDQRRARQYRAILVSLPSDTAESRILRQARNVGTSLTS